VERKRLLILRDTVTDNIMENKLYGTLNPSCKGNHTVKIGGMLLSMTTWSQSVSIGSIRKVVMPMLAQKPLNQLPIVVRLTRRSYNRLWLQTKKKRRMKVSICNIIFLPPKSPMHWLSKIWIKWKRVINQLILVFNLLNQCLVAGLPAKLRFWKNLRDLAQKE
jgi:hypothetical protein